MHIRAIFATSDEAQRELLLALLSDAGFEGFEENESSLLAYAAGDVFDAAVTDAIAAQAGARYRTEEVPAQNWNALWESNFQPVIIGDFCTIRAHFHDITAATAYDIVITPKMSFGTGHHATTRMMVSLMQQLDFEDSSVLDFGTGTGLLAILAEKMGAASVLAIDNDEWAVENAIENCERNECMRITVKQASLEDAGSFAADIILANINRQILLQFMPGLYRHTKPGGCMLISGILEADRDVLVQAASGCGFSCGEWKSADGWMAILFGKGA